MNDIAAIVAFLKRTYPVPEVDPAWVHEVVKALQDDGQATTIDELHNQYLHSDLALSTYESRTFPPARESGGELHDIILFPRPTLLQLVAISEIGHSAFQLQTTMEQRKEVLSGQSRIRRMDDEEDVDENGVGDGDGKVPPYPRGMLKLELSDGRRVVKAMEYRKIADLVLGQTSLGCKLLIQNVRCLRNVLLLAPDNTRVLESSVEHIEALQREQFLAELARRMGKADDIVTSERAVSVPPAIQHPPVAVSPAPRNPAVTLPAVRARPRNPPLPARPSPPPANLSPPRLRRPKAERHPGVEATMAKRQGKTSDNPRSKFEDHESTRSLNNTAQGQTPTRRPSRAAAQKATARLDLLYELAPPLNREELMEFGESDDDEQDNDEEEDGFDYAVDESFLRHIEEVEARASASAKPKSNGPRQKHSGGRDNDNGIVVVEGDDDDDATTATVVPSKMKVSPYFQNQNQNRNRRDRDVPKRMPPSYHEPDDYDDDDDEYEFDDSFIRQIDEVEAAAVLRTRGPSGGQLHSSGQSTLVGYNGRGGKLNGGGSEKKPVMVLDREKRGVKRSLSDTQHHEVIEISD